VPHFDFLNVMTNLGVTFFFMLERYFHAMNGVNNVGFFICWRSQHESNFPMKSFISMVPIVLKKLLCLMMCV
jgi:hypothetical protein